MEEAFNKAQKEASYHYGDHKSRQINKCDLTRDVTNDLEFALAVTKDKSESVEIEFQKKWLDKTAKKGSCRIQERKEPIRFRWLDPVIAGAVISIYQWD